MNIESTVIIACSPHEAFGASAGRVQYRHAKAKLPFGGAPNVPWLSLSIQCIVRYLGDREMTVHLVAGHQVNAHT
ncbi:MULTISPECIES: hypothetical protein [Burkholderia]|uniref:hypothetical protein n=1 Tax=Burkholderia TaxID=32008 RepID=UPI00136A79E9|nr:MULTISPECIES: hypothetical protein [Burkholderia]NBI50503.1 hypothetical protein [Burkholderia sp. ISTR5]